MLIHSTKYKPVYHLPYGVGENNLPREKKIELLVYGVYCICKVFAPFPPYWNQHTIGIIKDIPARELLKEAHK